MRPVAWIVVTDLDGTLLDHHSYSYAAAVPALQRLREQGIPLVLNTSKTRGELASLRRHLGISHPFVVENGSAVCLPAGYFEPPPADIIRLDDDQCRVFGVQYPQLLGLLDRLRPRYRFTSFSQMSAEQLAGLCGLSVDRARQALDREFSEPLVWEDSEDALLSFKRELRSFGLATLRGGRFLHVLGRVDKGRAVAWLRQAYGASGGAEVRVLALGDSDNDIAMLQAADLAVVVRSPAHEPPQFEPSGQRLVTEREGPLGWADSIHGWLDELDQPLGSIRQGGSRIF